jgi:hypothetical protein
LRRYASYYFLLSMPKNGPNNKNLQISILVGT